MEWEIAPNSRVDIVTYSGQNFSGHRVHIEIFPSGKKGTDFDGAEVQSVVVAGPIGTRVIFKTSVGPDWVEATWRAIEIRKGHAFKNRIGTPMVKVPNIDGYDKPDSQRCDPDFVTSYDIVTSPDQGKTWTYGVIARLPLKGNIRGVMVDKVKLPEKARP